LVEDRISRWLKDEAGGQLPDRVLGATFERTRMVRQQPVSFAWRQSPMTRPIPALIALGAAAIVIALGATILMAPSRQDLGIAVQSASASVVIEQPEGITAATADLSLEIGDFTRPSPQPPLPSPRVFETGSWTGPIEVATAGRTLSGSLRLDSNHELEYSRTGPSVNHAWGSLTGEIDSVPCTGSVAYSFYRDGLTGGTLFLRCADGSTLGGELPSVAITSSGGDSWRLTMRVEGSYETGR
jgi:hypothetical protein